MSNNKRTTQKKRKPRSIRPQRREFEEMGVTGDPAAALLRNRGLFLMLSSQASYAAKAAQRRMRDMSFRRR